MGELNESVNIPVWVLKLGAFLVSGLSFVILSWATWLTLQVMDNRLYREKLTEISMEVKSIDACTRNMQSSIDGIVAVMKWEQGKATQQTKIP